MAKRTDEMKSYEDTKGDLETQLRQEVVERMRAPYSRTTKIGEEGELIVIDRPQTAGARDSLKVYPSGSEEDKTGAYTIRTPGGTFLDNFMDEDSRFIVETPKSSHDEIKRIYEDFQKGSMTREPVLETVQKLRDAGVSVPNISPVNTTYESFPAELNAFMRDLIVRTAPED